MDSQDRLFRFRLPFHLPSSTIVRSGGVYISGALFAIAFWFLIDAAIYSKTVNASVVHVTFIDWIPGICSALGMLIVTSIDKSRLFDDALGGGASSTTYQARVILFLGFSLLAGGLAGSFVVLIMKFISKGYNEYPTLGMGVANVITNVSIMLSCISLWVSQSVEDEYSYSLAL
ncbi:Vps68 protein [Saccharomycopsis crataegensis]|uniref:Vps68 protein n=1 Tax=Saccharomycopsis crataegensis TaxID=43959 RepID=A0AAV5QMT9_9ASCO|nr:Vps68 protein [Saccharomycopsis crataegensis]